MHHQILRSTRFTFKVLREKVESESQKVENHFDGLLAAAADQLGRNEPSFLTKIVMDGPTTISIGHIGTTV